MTEASNELCVYFNLRSPYCYLASKRMFDVFDRFTVEVSWKPLGGWDGRSPPERAQGKLPIARQDVSRWAARLGIPFTPPPKDTDPTNAALVSLAAEKAGMLREFVIEVMRAEWGRGEDIGQPEVLRRVCETIGIGAAAVDPALADPAGAAALERNWQDAQTDGVIGVPSFVIGSEIFWGNDRLDFLSDHLTALRLARL